MAVAVGTEGEAVDAGAVDGEPAGVVAVAAAAAVDREEGEDGLAVMAERGESSSAAEARTTARGTARSERGAAPAKKRAAAVGAQRPPRAGALVSVACRRRRGESVAAMNVGISSLTTTQQCAKLQL